MQASTAVPKIKRGDKGLQPTIALVLVALLVGLLTIYRWWHGSKAGTAWAAHLGQAVLCGGLVWLLNLSLGWGRVHELDAILSGLGVLLCAGLGLGLLSALALYFENCRALLGLLLPDSHSKIRSNQTPPAPAPKFAALPLPNKATRLDWCPECNRWHSAQTNHKHNLVG